ncbi:hypothetical protein GOP47_0003210 [Adiantum capillus-veneris]|uniref:Uncharacterized protein n=1 Tax=Adiantum capillus-veneris TaxID=13818 RepID=A0A9D4ZS17_ADICA|nr:hypothetical protein GOP47_0003210 [Adiantum capillus-veneris]
MGVEYECDDGAAWEQQLEGYASFIEALNKPKLQELDDFYTRSLPSLVQERHPSPFITAQELVKVVQWKLSRGKWRPKLLSFASALTDDDVKAASLGSFSALPDLKVAINALTALKGVGPATASAILAAAAPDVAPFMSDEAMIAVLGGVKDYTLKQYLLFAEKLQCKAQELTKSSGKEFRPSELERALWCAAMEKRFPKSEEIEKQDQKESEKHSKASNDISTKDSTRKRRKRN